MLYSPCVVSELQKGARPYRQLSHFISYVGHFCESCNFCLFLRYAVFSTFRVLTARNGNFKPEVQREVTC